jgi:hypothetical protein
MCVLKADVGGHFAQLLIDTTSMLSTVCCLCLLLPLNCQSSST